MLGGLSGPGGRSPQAIRQGPAGHTEDLGGDVLPRPQPLPEPGPGASSAGPGGEAARPPARSPAWVGPRSPARTCRHMRAAPGWACPNQPALLGVLLESKQTKKVLVLPEVPPAARGLRSGRRAPQASLWLCWARFGQRGQGGAGPQGAVHPIRLGRNAKGRKEGPFGSHAKAAPLPKPRGSLQQSGNGTKQTGQKPLPSAISWGCGRRCPWGSRTQRKGSRDGPGPAQGPDALLGRRGAPQEAGPQNATESRGGREEGEHRPLAGSWADRGSLSEAPARCAERSLPAHQGSRTRALPLVAAGYMMLSALLFWFSD